MKTLALVAAAVALTACADTLTAPHRLTPPARSSHDLTCKSGYMVAYQNGQWVCVPDSTGGTI